MGSFPCAKIMALNFFENARAVSSYPDFPCFGWKNSVGCLSVGKLRECKPNVLLSLTVDKAWKRNFARTMKILGIVPSGILEFAGNEEFRD